MAKRKGEFEVRGLWAIYKQVPRSERRKIIQAMRATLRGRTIEELTEVAERITELEPGVMHCPFCDTPLTPNAKYGADDTVSLRCRPCERSFEQVKQ